MKFELLIPPWLIIAYTFCLLVLFTTMAWSMHRQEIKTWIRNRDIGAPLTWLRQHERKTVLCWTRRILLVFIPVLIAVGPSIQNGTSSPGISNLDIIFAVDTTPSMGAQDYNNGKLRLDGVKADMLALAGRIEGANLEIISFDSDANVILPFTNDVSAFSSAVEGLTPQVSDYSRGSMIDKPIKLINRELAYSKKSDPTHQRLLFYLGDGEQTANANVATFSSITSKLNGGAVLGYGTVIGGKMYNYAGTYTSKAKLPYIMTVDLTTNKLVPAVSKSNPKNLSKIASETHLAYKNRNKAGSIDQVYNESKLPLAIDKSHHITRYLNIYWLFAIPLAGLFFWEWQALIVGVLELIREQRKTQNRGNDDE